jgi:lipopolysaccharide/colanic/teichoic acid biosynthesis glycosyltransferase
MSGDRSRQADSDAAAAGRPSVVCTEPRVGGSGIGAGHEAREAHPSMRGMGRRMKRALDLTVASGSLLVLLPVFLIIAAAIKVTSPGPVFFRQERVGRQMQRFWMLKFRSMVANAEDLRQQMAGLNDAQGISFKIFRDPRVTSLGRWLRRTSLDELPQLVNVLTGDMSLVGPRPIPVWVAEQLNKGDYLRRFTVQPGLTGLWQVEGRQQDFDWMALQDLRYVDNWSLGVDLKILLATIPAVFRGEGAH